jgi:GT2 family glycosyltransferase
MNSVPEIAVVLLNWNQYDDTVDCLASLYGSDYPRFKVIMLDNGSSDGSGGRLAALFPRVDLIHSAVNLGFDGGNNLGIMRALNLGCDYLLLLNNDTVLDPTFLSELIEVARTDPNIGILGPKIYYYEEPDVIWWAGCRLNISPNGMFSFSQEGNGQKDMGQFDEVVDVDGAIGCAMLIKRDVIERIGLLDERFFIYHEEHDYALRAISEGYRIVFVPRAHLWHKVSRAMGGVHSVSQCHLWSRNWLLLMRNHTPLARWPFLYYHYIKEAYWVYQGYMEQDNPEGANAALDGIVSAVLNDFGPISPRRCPAPLSWLVKRHFRYKTGRINGRADRD